MYWRFSACPYEGFEQRWSSELGAATYPLVSIALHAAVALAEFSARRGD